MREILHDFRCQQQSGRGGHKCGGARERAPRGDFFRILRRIHRRKGGLCGIYDLEMIHMAFAHLMPHDARQGTYLGVIDIRDAEGGGINLVSGTHAADDRHAGFLCCHDQVNLGGNGIDAVNHIVILGKVELIRGFRHVKVRETVTRHAG